MSTFLLSYLATFSIFYLDVSEILPIFAGGKRKYTAYEQSDNAADDSRILQVHNGTDPFVHADVQLSTLFRIFSGLGKRISLTVL